MKRSPIKRRNSKRDWWTPLRNKLKFAFTRAGIERCEIHHTGCTGSMFLGFAHSLKRRYIKTDAEKQEVCLACTNCHDHAASLGHERETALIRYIIVMRENAVEKI